MSKQRASYEIAAENLAILSNSLGLDMVAKFVPFSQSRNAAEKMPSLNWLCTITRNGKPIITTDYMQGCAHAPAYNSNAPEYGRKHYGGMSIARDKAVRLECESGKVSKPGMGSSPYSSGKPIAAPSINDVLASLCMDSDVLNYPSFADWAESFGYDTDSRKAELIYRQCLEIALALRAAIGDNALAQLCEYTESDQW